jgi:signal transduction histidine kinase
MRSFAAAALFSLLTFGLCASAVAEGADTAEPPDLLTNLFQLRQCAEQKPSVMHPFRIVADVLDADSGNGVLVLRDDSGVEFIQLDLQGQTIAPGMALCLEGKGCGVEPTSFGLAIVPGMVVDNDGLHGMAPVSGTVFLHAGINPIAVQWFNGSGGFGLNVEYAGPGLRRAEVSSAAAAGDNPRVTRDALIGEASAAQAGLMRQPIPSSVLSTAKISPATGITNFSPGLDYRCYEGAWVRLPDFAKHQPVSMGVTTNFDLGVRTRNAAVGLEFNGFITIPQDGAYTFYLASDDGSRLFAGASSLDVRAISGPSTALTRQHKMGEGGRGSNLITLEGTVKFAGVRGAGGELVLRVGNDDIRVGVFGGGETAPSYLTDVKVRVSGIYQDVVMEDGSQGPGMLLVSSWKALHPVPAAEKHSAMVISNEVAPNQPAEKKASAAAATPTITTAAEVKALTSEMAKQELPVTIRGVATAILADYLHGAVIQDSTKGIFVSLQNIPDPKPLQRGEFYQIEGVTGPGDFAPLVIARRITHLGVGQMPQPVRPTWNQLFNGSLDTQYAEIEGVVSAINNQRIEMLTANGKITLELNDFQSEDLADYENDVVRIRGCAFAFFNTQTRELDASSLRILGGAVDVLQPAPRDLFDAPQKNLGELLLFDPKAAPFHRLKVAAQVIHGRAGEYFLTDGNNGIRVATRQSDPFAAGDLVEAVGFLDLGGAAAELKEAVMRKTGHAGLPLPKKLGPEQMLSARHAGMLVQVDATLMNQWREGSESVLELQSGFLAFKARISEYHPRPPHPTNLKWVRGETEGGEGQIVIPGQSISLPPSGSQLELTGVYVPQGNRLRGGTVNGFELLLGSPSDIRVLATPPWWTLKRVLAVSAILAALLCAVLLWNKELQRKVQERGRQLEREVRHRQQAELQHAAEAERSRIARDLHDELGTGLTEVSLLASTGSGESREVENNNDRLRVIAEKARALVSGLDVIVWAIDPKRNSLQSFADYLGRYATELFAASNILCRFKIPIECEAVALAEAARHSLFLAVKEALNNVIRHASATEVKLQMTQANYLDPLPPSPQANWVRGEAGREERVTIACLEIVITDNGRGFDLNTIRRGNGLTNLHERLKALNGQCHVESQTGKGTTVKFTLPLPRNPD